MQAIDGLFHLKFTWMEIGGVGGKTLLLAVAKETRKLRNDRVRFKVTKFNHWKFKNLSKFVTFRLKLLTVISGIVVFRAGVASA